MEVSFITLGDVAERLSVPAPTLRNWTDQLEEFDAHYVKRNNRNERIYEDSDLAVFEFIRDLKQEYGRKTTMKDIVNLLKSNESRFNLRSQADAPSPVQEPSNKTSELLTPDDVERLAGNPRVRALMGFAMEKTMHEFEVRLAEFLVEERNQMKMELINEIKEGVQKGEESIIKALSTISSENTKVIESNFEQIVERNENLEKNVQNSLKIFQDSTNAVDEKISEFANQQQTQLEEIAKRESEMLTLIKDFMEEQQRQKAIAETEPPKKGFFGFFKK